MVECLIVGIGGFIGAVCRYLIGLISLKESSLFPIKTFIINVIGSLIIGIIAAIALKNDSLNPRMILFLKVGICGGFITFSSFVLESSDLMKNGHTTIALIYVVLSVICGVLAVFIGESIVK